MKNIVLFGFMGTGKSAVGKKLAEDLGMKFVEMDAVIEKQEEMTINDIFAKKGEWYFRSLEKNLVKDLGGQKGLVISTGGGVVLNADNIKDFEKDSFLVCLNASPEEIYNRIKNEEHRPLLKVDDPLKKIKELLDYRMPYYNKIKIQIDTVGMRVEEVVSKIKGMLNEND